MSVLFLLEDNDTLGSGLSERLTQEGHILYWCKSVADGLMLLKNVTPDLAIVDISLPDGNGIDFTRTELQPRGILPIILSAFSSAEYRMDAFDAGAIDFVPKPFHLRELLIRIKHALEKKISPSPQVISVGELTIDLKTGAVTVHGQTTVLHARENMLLTYLISRSPSVVSRQELAEQVWKDEGGAAHRTVDNAVVKLRQVLGSEHEGLIRSARGIGYQWLVT